MTITDDNFKYMLATIRATYCFDSQEDYADEIANKECLQGCIDVYKDINNLPPTILREYIQQCIWIDENNLKIREELKKSGDYYNQMLLWLSENPTHFPSIIGQKLSKKLISMKADLSVRYSLRSTPTLQEWCNDRTRAYRDCLNTINDRLAFTDAFKILEQDNG